MAVDNQPVHNKHLENAHEHVKRCDPGWLWPKFPRTVYVTTMMRIPRTFSRIKPTTCQLTEEYNTQFLLMEETKNDTCYLYRTSLKPGNETGD